MKNSCSTKRNSSKRKKLIIWLVVILIVICSIFVYFNNYVNPVIISTNSSVIKAKTTQILNECIAKSLTQTDVYEQLVTINNDTNGNVTSISANTLNANKLNNTILSACQQALNNQSDLYFEVPLGTFSGIPALNGIGPNIKIRMLPVGNIESSFKSNFTSVGINQTHHEIYLNFKINISVLLPGTDKTVCVNSQVLLAESVIVGKVPEVYFGNSNLLNSELNLVP